MTAVSVPLNGRAFDSQDNGVKSKTSWDYVGPAHQEVSLTLLFSKFQLQRCFRYSRDDEFILFSASSVSLERPLIIHYPSSDRNPPSPNHFHQTINHFQTNWTLHCRKYQSRTIPLNFTIIPPHSVTMAPASQQDHM